MRRCKNRQIKITSAGHQHVSIVPHKFKSCCHARINTKRLRSSTFAYPFWLEPCCHVWFPIFLFISPSIGNPNHPCLELLTLQANTPFNSIRFIQKGNFQRHQNILIAIHDQYCSGNLPSGPHQGRLLLFPFSKNYTVICKSFRNT